MTLLSLQFQATIPVARRITLFFRTSTTPPFTCRFFVPSFDLYSTTPSFNKLISGAWSSITWNDPSEPGKVTIVTSPENNFFSGVNISRCIAIVSIDTGMRSYTPLNYSLPFSFCHHLLSFLNGLFNATYEIERHFGKVVVFTIHDGIEAFDGIFNIHQYPFETCKGFCNVKWL